MTSNPLSPVGPTNGAALAAQAQTKYTPLDPIRVMRQYKWLLVVATIVGCGMGVGLWWAMEKYAPQYTSETYLVIRQALQDAYQMSAEAGAIDRGQNQAVIICLNCINDHRRWQCRYQHD